MTEVATNWGTDAFTALARAIGYEAQYARSVARIGNVSVYFDVQGFSDQLLAVAQRQVPFALALALNRTAEEAQAAVQTRIRMRGFVIRSAASDAWLAKQVKFYRGDRATKDKLEAALMIDRGGGSGGADSGSFVGNSLLAFLEEGGDRVGARPIGSGTLFARAVVIPVRSNPFETIPRSLYPVNVGLTPRRKIAGGFTKASLQGKRGTFAIRMANGEGMVLQRLGHGQRNTRVLFFIRERARVPGRHFFFSVVHEVFEARFKQNFEGFFVFALSTAKPA